MLELQYWTEHDEKINEKISSNLQLNFYEYLLDFVTANKLNDYRKKMIDDHKNMPDIDTLTNDLNDQKQKKQQLNINHSISKNIATSLGHYKQAANQYLISSKNRFVLLNNLKHCFTDADATKLSLYELQNDEPNDDGGDADNNESQNAEIFQDTNSLIDDKIKINYETAITCIAEEEIVFKYNYLRFAVATIQKENNKSNFILKVNEQLKKMHKMLAEHMNYKIKYDEIMSLELMNKSLESDIIESESENVVINQKINEYYNQMTKIIADK